MMKNMLTTAFAVLLSLTGVGLFAYPAVSDWLAQKNHSTAIQEYVQAVERLDNSLLLQEREAAERYNSQLTGVGVEDPFVPGSGMVMGGNYASILNIDGVMGSIEIPQIQVSLPIYHGTSEEVLQKGVGHLETTALPIGGEGNHTVLTGHRGLSSATLFTDLDQLEEGDAFYLHVLNETLKYRVAEIRVIEPSDTERLGLIAGKDCVTLITCTPYAINSHRLTIRGERVLYDAEEEWQEGNMPSASSVARGFNAITAVRVSAMGALLLLLLTLLVLTLRWRRNRGKR